MALQSYRRKSCRKLFEYAMIKFDGYSSRCVTQQLEAKEIIVQVALSER